MRVTDSQVHIWEEHLPDRPAHMGPNFPVERLLREMEQARVDRVVLVPSSKSSPSNPAAVNEYTLAAAEKYPRKFAVIGLVDLGRPDRGQALAALMKRPGVKGVRILLRRESPDTIDWIAREAMRLGFTLAVLANRGSFEALPALVAKFPDLSILLDHAALPAHGPDPFAEFDRVLELAKAKSLVVKSSGMTRWSQEPYPFSDIQSRIRNLVDAFGPERLAWGSDFTWEVGRIPYSQTVDLFREACDFLTPSDREWILDKTLARTLRWDT